VCTGLGNSRLPDPLRIVLIPYGGKELVASDQDELGPFRDQSVLVKEQFVCVEE